jgi:hypothetical protein
MTTRKGAIFKFQPLGKAWRVTAILIGWSAIAYPAYGTESVTPTPDFSGLWARETLGFESPLSGRGPVTNKMRLLNGRSDLNTLVGDPTNPILKSQAAEILKKKGEISLGGTAYPQPQNQCLPYPLPYILSINQEIQILQQKDQVTILNMFDHQIRQVRMNRSHPAHVNPSSYGDSIGHYDGAALLVETIGIKLGPLPMVDMYGTPYSPALHVVERYYLIDGQSAKEAAERGERENLRITGDGAAVDPTYTGDGLQVQITVEDPGVFTTPWTALVTYRRALGDWLEQVCAENFEEYYSGRRTPIPTADKPDF